MELATFKYQKPVSKITNERQDIIRQFVDEINTEREGTAYKKIWPKVVAIKLGHLKKDELYWFLSTCKEYKAKHGSFSKAFFGALKTKNFGPQKALF